MNVKSEKGFSYIEVMVAMVILLVGILALLSGISGAVLQSRGQEQQLMARHLAATAMESIMAVKETDPTRMGWNAVGNVGSNPINGVPQGIFVTGRRNVMTNAGPDEVIGTADDNGAVVPGYQRQIVITDQCDPDRPSPNCPTPGTANVRIRLVEVTVFYFVGRMQRQEQLTSVLSDYAVTE
jgi:prepilin-type N-terminal cleavage/methylation domain-containing protein